MDSAFVSQTDKDIIAKLFACNLPRTLCRHAILVFHHYRTFSSEDGIPMDAVIGGCVLYAMKQRHCILDSTVLKDLMNHAKESEIVGFELTLVQVVRQNILLVEACLRSVLCEVVNLNPDVVFDRINVVLVSLHLISEVYKSRWCLFPESSARGAFLLAVEFCHVPALLLPDTFRESRVMCIVEYLRKCFSNLQ